MPNYLSKEEIRQWRSSLEKITLEEFAARLGKTINEQKETHDIVDKVLKSNHFISEEPESYQIKAEKIGALAQRAMEREKEIKVPEESLLASQKEIKKDKVKPQVQEKSKPVEKKAESVIKEEVVAVENKVEDALLEEVQLTFKKALTPREQAVFDYFVKNRSQVIYAKDLAKLLDLPRDYVYKYIKNLRNKINEDAIQNSENGGFILKV